MADTMRDRPILSPNPKLAGRVAVVTGAAGGIGLAIVEALLAEGASTVLAVRERNDAIDAAAEDFASRHGRPVPILEADVTDEAAVASLYRTVFESYRRLDILVNNAGVLESAPIGMTSPDQVSRIVGVNLVGTINHCRQAVRLMMRKRTGNIVNIASLVGIAGSPGQSVYAASKAGVNGLTRSLAKELGPHGIRVNAVAPGFIETNMTSGFGAEQRRTIQDDTALRRLGTPCDVALAVAFLASDAAGFITGQVLCVDGGLTI